MQKETAIQHFRVPKTGDVSLKVQFEKGANYYPLRHYHPEIQLSLILDGHGTRFIGDSIGAFTEGDVYMIGSNVPHVFRNERDADEAYYRHRAHSVSVYFNPEALGETFLSLPETHAISGLMKQSAKGIKLLGQTREQVAHRIRQMRDLKGFRQLMELLDTLDLIQRYGEYDLLSNQAFHQPVRDTDNRRLSALFDHVTSGYHRQISLDEAASVASMSTTAFCRYFKKHTGQTFTEFLNRTRISIACKMILEKEESVSEIAYGCGYNSIPYFNRQFKKYTGRTPLTYRRKLNESI